MFLRGTEGGRGVGGRVVSLGSAEGAGRGHVNGKAYKREDLSISGRILFWKHIPQAVLLHSEAMRIRKFGAC